MNSVRVSDRNAEPARRSGRRPARRSTLWSPICVPAVACTRTEGDGHRLMSSFVGDVLPDRRAPERHQFWRDLVLLPPRQYCLERVDGLLSVSVLAAQSLQGPIVVTAQFQNVLIGVSRESYEA